MAYSTIRRRWRICCDCYKAFTTEKAKCPSCGSLKYSGVGWELNQQEIEDAKSEILDQSYRRMKI